MRTPFGFVVLPAEEDRFHGLVAAKTTKAYTTRDQFDWPVHHKKGERAGLRLEDFGERLLPGDKATHAWLMDQKGEQTVMEVSENNEVSFVLKETKLAIGGLMRCCTGSLGEFISQNPDDTAQVGTLVYCKYEGNDPTSMILGDDGVWRWNHP